MWQLRNSICGIRCESPLPDRDRISKHLSFLHPDSKRRYRRELLRHSEYTELNVPFAVAEKMIRLEANEYDELNEEESEGEI